MEQGDLFACNDTSNNKGRLEPEVMWAGMEGTSVRARLYLYLGTVGTLAASLSKEFMYLGES